jgi:uncharacterized membrane protein
MRMSFAALIGVLQLLCLAALPHAAAATTLPHTGQIVADRIALFGKHIPLPPGEWRVVASSYAHVTGADPGPYGAIGGVLLVRPTEDPERTFLLVRTNAVPVRGGWGQPAECISDYTLFESEAEPRDLINACSFVTVSRAGRITALIGDPSAATFLPPWALVAGFRASDRNDVIDVRYGIVPHTPAPVEWFGSREALDASHAALVARFGEWAQQARQASFAALRDPIDQVPTVPQVALTAPGKVEIKGEDITALRLGLYKLATYRGPVTAWNWALASTLAGDLYVGAIIAGWQSITHSAIYFGNEMAWELPSDVASMGFRGAHPVAASRALPDAAPEPTRDGFAVDGKQVPLPSGAWTRLANITDAAADATMLARLDGKHLLGLVAIRANPKKTTDIFGTASDCSRSDIYFSTIRYDTPVDGYCSYAKLVIPDDALKNDALWAAVRTRLAEAGVIIPPALLVVGARARTRENYIDARYYFPTDGAMSEAGPALQAWADLVQLPLELGVRGRLPPSVAEVPGPMQVADVQAALIRQAHAPLERLHAAGAIDDAEFQRQLAQADAALAERERQRWSLWKRSAYKVATYRALSYVDAITVSWIITFSPEQSFVYATINAVAQPIMAYANEIGWAGSGVGRPTASLLPVDFPEIGRDRL